MRVKSFKRALSRTYSRSLLKKHFNIDDYDTSDLWIDDETYGVTNAKQDTGTKAG